jgi:hypothetical protein
MTRKVFSKPGSIRFQVINGTDRLEFYVDGLLKARWFGMNDWAEYVYTLEAGDHILKWIATGDQVGIDEVCFDSGFTQHSPGEYVGGGIVFYVDSSLEHGLIAAFEDGTYDGHREIPWGCNGLQLTSGNRASSNSDGERNTLAIIRDCDWEQTAARYCHNLEVGDGLDIYDDWYLPALDELDLLYKHREIVGNLDGQYYWSSTSQTTFGARVINFYDGSHHGANRNIPKVAGPVSAGIFVRPIRKF